MPHGPGSVWTILLSSLCLYINEVTQPSLKSWDSALSLQAALKLPVNSLLENMVPVTTIPK